MGKIVLEDFNEGNGYYKVNLAYLNKEQVEEIENLVSKWNPTDEDIKSCIAMCLTDVNEQRFKDYGTNLRDCLAWLERQGEQKPTKEKMITPEESLGIDSETHNKIVDECIYGNHKPADKVEPKFKVGDWCIDNDNGTTFQIVKVLDNTYTYKTNEGNEYSCTHCSLENVAHLWTIEDAKDGDILAVEPIEENYRYPFVAIFKGRGLDFFSSYCFIGFDGNFYGGGARHTIENIHPATKEQRNLLFQKMNETGYEWDVKKNELKKIEQKLAENTKPQSSTPMSYGKELEKRMYEACDRFYAPNTDSNRYSASDLFYAGVKAERDLNTLAWSEEDEKFFKAALWHISYSISNGESTDIHCDITEWLKSLKQKIGG